MTAKNKSHANDVTYCYSIERGDIERASCYNNITSSWEDEFFRFASFILRSRFNNDHNLKLAYLLIHAQNVSLAEAAIILKISRALFYTKILPENPAFVSAKRPISGWGNGGQERRIKLSKEALEFSKFIAKLAEYHLGENECQRLRIEASKVRKRLVKKEEKYRKRLEALKRNINHPDFNRFLAFAAKDFGKTKEEVLADLEEMLQETKTPQKQAHNITYQTSTTKVIRRRARG